ncbi:PREDICTED: disease resistance protein RPM1-like [Nelumbo nucifera]|uniref:Disease resistance protein RPM1-like n=2 Tax=Nelumbo nucifera TaxID=4432 RepID=A0A822XI68_NELNU|nr:PREDICTED: disease resistance protein RPM1-like [Nelumbo nucifera]DAD19393.1 TPA_asm: hypothetical protein HUJ06_020856 [Nelumbo nucifera]
MAEALLVSVITKLGEIALKEVAPDGQHQVRTTDDIRFIKDELSTMKAFLRDAEKKSMRGEVVSEWVAQVRDEAYKIQDVLEEFLLRMDLLRARLTRRHVGCLDIKFYICYIPSFNKQMTLCREFHSEIECIKREVEAISRRRLQYNLQEEVNSSNHEEETRGDYGLSSPFVEEANIIGIDKDVEKLENWLLKEGVDENHQRSIISVVGMGGLGKTTLVKKVYNSIKGHFECSAWVSVSQAFELRGILRRLMEEFYESRKQAPPKGMEAMAVEKLQQTTYGYLQGKSYILVLDDIWDVNAWEVVKIALPCKGKCKVIFTTRLEDVASPTGETNYVHKLQKLPPNLAWDLFYIKQFKNNNPSVSFPSHLKEIGEAIVKKCDGLPLALGAIGGLMSKKGTNPSVWDDVLKNLDWELNHSQDLQRLSAVLLTSYNYLPSPQKYCFLYCGFFPVDYRIKTSRLIRLWVAEGFVEDHPRKTPEEVAANYLVQLINRSILQVDIDKLRVGLNACRVHDLMREMAIQIFKKEEFGVVYTNHPSNGLLVGSHRRIAFHNKIADNSLTWDNRINHEQNNPRSFLTFSVKEVSYSALRQMLLNLKSLRLLDLSETKIEHLPSEIGNLIHLRYLGLRWTQIHQLPSSLQKLHNLQTLDLRNTKVESFPPKIQIATFPQMRHLLLTNNREKLSDRTFTIHILRRFTIGANNRELSNLQTLSGVKAHKSLASQLGYLNGLRKLYIVEVRREYCTELCAALRRMEHLRSLRICSNTKGDVLDLEMMSPPPPHIEKLSLDGIMECLPQWVCSLNNLHTIKLFDSRLTDDPMLSLSQLPNLEILVLSTAYMGRQMGWISSSSGDVGFPKLRSLCISDMLNLEEFTEIEEGMLQCLWHVVIGFCPKLKKLPHGFQHLKTIHSLILAEMPEDFIQRLRFNGGEDYWMIQYIPKTMIENRSMGCLSLKKTLDLVDMTRNLKKKNPSATTD